MPFSWGILGAGDIARRHMAPAMLHAPGHRLAAIMRRDRHEAERFAKEFEVPRGYTQAEELVSDPGIDAVYIATPPSSHAVLTDLAARHGKHVLCEKPIASSEQEAAAMIDSCARYNVRLMICHYQRFNQRHRQIRAWLADGAIGRLVAIRINFSSYSPPTPGRWHYSRAIGGGGSLMDLGSHCLDLLIYLAGPIASSTGLAGCFASDSRVEDTATMLLGLQNGAHATVSTHWSVRIPDEVDGNGIELWGTEGSIVASPLFSKDSSGTLRLYRSRGVEDHSHPGAGRIHAEVIEHFRQAIETGAPVLAPAEDALAGLRILLPLSRTVS
jgi:1,5-anhydro-D-fructose reductase (1,5-anhydro-D-mannitol-forming)